VSENLIRCYERLVDDGFLPREEIPLVRAWAHDVEQIRNGSDRSPSSPAAAPSIEYA
jgi:hypothetical protein